MGDVVPLIHQTPTHSPLAQAQLFLATRPSIQVIIVNHLDLSGIVRHKLIPASTLLTLLSSPTLPRISCSPLQLTTSTTEAIPRLLFSYFSGRGTATLDISTLRPMLHDAAGLGNCASIVADYDWRGLSSRRNLRHVVERVERDFGLRFLVGFEIEVVLLKEGSLEPIDLGGMGMGWSRRSTAWKVINEITLALAEGGIHVEGAEKEFGLSQWEFVLPPYNPVEAVDNMLYAREVVKDVAAKWGMVGTTFPTPYAEGGKGSRQKSGLHVHVSVENIRGKKGEGWEDRCMAGILGRVKELMAIAMPTMDSYERVASGRVLTGGYVGWGFNHRDMPVRQVERNHWEVRCVDGCANGYAVVAGIIMAAAEGRELTMKGAHKWTPYLTDEEREKLGITELLPRSLEEAIAELDKSRGWWDGVLGEKYVEFMLELKSEEIKMWKEMDVDARRLRLVQYF